MLMYYCSAGKEDILLNTTHRLRVILFSSGQYGLYKFRLEYQQHTQTLCDVKMNSWTQWRHNGAVRYDNDNSKAI